MYVVKKVISHITQPLTYICSTSFKTGIFPDEMKMAKVIPVNKTVENMEKQICLVLLEMTEEITNALTIKSLTGMFMSLTKGFDSVNNLLIHILEMYGICGIVLKCNLPALVMSNRIS